MRLVNLEGEVFWFPLEMTENSPNEYNQLQRDLLWDCATAI